MITKLFYTREGVEVRELTEEEIIDFASLGDEECMGFLFQREYAAAVSDSQKIVAIHKRITKNYIKEDEKDGSVVG